MKLFARYLIRWQWVVMVILMSITGVALYGMTRLSVDPSNARLLPRQGEDAQVYQRFLTTFGSDEDILIGGFTSYDAPTSANQQALDGIMKEWKRTDADYATRISQLQNGGGLNDGSIDLGSLSPTTRHVENRKRLVNALRRIHLATQRHDVFGFEKCGLHYLHKQLLKSTTPLQQRRCHKTSSCQRTLHRACCIAKDG